jgi:hypothetical protein
MGLALASAGCGSDADETGQDGGTTADLSVADTGGLDAGSPDTTGADAAGADAAGADAATADAATADAATADAATADAATADAATADTATADTATADAATADAAGAADAAAASNASCSSPKIVSLAAAGPTTIQGDTTGAADEFATVSCGNVNGPWPGGQRYYKVTLAAGKIYKVSMVTQGWDGALYAFPAGTGCSAAAINAGCAGSSSDQIGSSKVESLYLAPKVGGNWILVADSWSAKYDYGPFTITIETGTTPVNAVCSGAKAVTLGAGGKATITGDTSSFVTNEFTKLSCGGKTPYTGPQLYYKVQLTGGKAYRLRLSADFLAFFYLFTPASCTEQAIETACASDGQSGDTMWVMPQVPLELSFTPQSSGVVHLAVDSWSPSVGGKFTLDISELGPIPTFTAPFSFNFEGDCKGLAATNDWACGAFAFKAGSGCDAAAAPPKAPHSGSSMWGTTLNDCYTALGNNHNGTTAGCSNELPNDDSTLRFRVAIPATWSKATLSYWSWEDLYTPYDWGEVWVDGKLVAGSQLCSSTYTAPTAWVKRTVDLGAHAGKTVEVALHMLASGNTNYAGWYIDDLAVTGGP